jgi:hypothetical protein
LTNREERARLIESTPRKEAVICDDEWEEKGRVPVRVFTGRLCCAAEPIQSRPGRDAVRPHTCVSQILLQLVCLTNANLFSF